MIDREYLARISHQSHKADAQARDGGRFTLAGAAGLCQHTVAVSRSGEKCGLVRDQLILAWGIIAALCCSLHAAENNTSAPGDVARDILEQAGVKGGLIVHVGCGDGRITAALRAGDSYLVHGLESDAADVEQARGHVRSLGLYGKVWVQHWTGEHLPYAENMVNLVVMRDTGCGMRDAG